jgi:hypothetical protein
MPNRTGVGLDANRIYEYSKFADSTGALPYRGDTNTPKMFFCMCRNLTRSNHQA